MQLDFLNDIHSHSSKKEVVSKIAIPLLKQLGYEFYDWEAKNSIFSFKPDFIIHSFDPKHPYLVVDVKRASADIKHSNDSSIIKFLTKTNATLGLLTNGHHFQVYFNDGNSISKILDYSKVNLEEFFSLFEALLGRNTLFQINQEIEGGVNLSYPEFFYQVWDKYAPEENIEKDNKDSKIAQFANTATIKQKKKHKNKKAKIITVFNNKGGVGKTTITTNLGAALNQKGNKVLLVDIDAQANLTTGLGIDPYEDLELNDRKDISDLLIDPKVKADDELIITKSWKNTSLDILPAHIRLAEERDNLIVKQLNYDSLLKRKLDYCLDDYDYILIDPPPSFGVANRMALMACDALLVPTQFAPYSIRALEYVIKRVIAVQEAKGEELDILGMAVSMYLTDAQRITFDSINHINELLEEIKEECAENLPKGNIGLLPENTWIPHYSVISSTSSDEKACPLNEIKDEQAQEAFQAFLHLASYVEDYFARKERRKTKATAQSVA